MKEFNKLNLVAVRAELSKAIAAFAADNPEFAAEVGRCKYTDTSCTFAVEISLKDADGNVLNRDRSDYLRFAGAYGMKPEWLDGIVLIKGIRYKVIGLQSSRRTRPVLMLNLDNNKQYLFRSTDVVRIFAKAGA